MRENLYRLWFLILMVGLLILLGRNIRAQESSLGTFPLPDVVGMTQKTPPPISIDILPKIALANPYKRQTFRIRIRIERDDRNRRYSFAGDCGSDAHSHQRDVEGSDAPITYTFTHELTVVQSCIFQACVHRIEGGKVKNYCAHQEVKTPEVDNGTSQAVHAPLPQMPEADDVLHGDYLRGGLQNHRQWCLLRSRDHFG